MNMNKTNYTPSKSPGGCIYELLCTLHRPHLVGLLHLKFSGSDSQCSSGNKLAKGLRFKVAYHVAIHVHPLILVRLLLV